MFRLRRSDESQLRGPRAEAGGRLGLATLSLIVLVVVVAACGPVAEPTALPTAMATALPAPTDAPAAETMITPAVTVSDQEVVDGTVVVDEVVSKGSGWVVIHAQADGKPGSILGYSPVADGINAEVTVAIDASGASETLYAMLHTDGGKVGAWEFPNGPDTPVMVGEQMVSPAFVVRQQAAASQTAPAATFTPQSSSVSEIPGAVVVTGDEAEVEMEDFQFRPKVLVIRPGTTVKFANKDGVQHTATSDTGVFDSGYLSKGEEYTFTFTEPGTFPYYCIPHGGPGGVGMSATIIVQP
jgi:plastocyanin